MARQLQAHGITAAALQGGWEAWRAEFTVEPVPTAAVQPADD